MYESITYMKNNWSNCICAGISERFVKLYLPVVACDLRKWNNSIISAN